MASFSQELQKKAARPLISTGFISLVSNQQVNLTVGLGGAALLCCVRRELMFDDAVKSGTWRAQINDNPNASTARVA